MMRTSDDFGEMEMVGGGDESWRAVSLLFSASHIYFATDAEYQENRIYSIERGDWVRKPLASVDGPVYYTNKVSEDLFFGVTAEMCPSGQGRYGSLWNMRDDGIPKKLFSSKKDMWPILLMPGTIHFPGGPGRRDKLMFNCVGLRNVDGLVYTLERNF